MPYEPYSMNQQQRESAYFNVWSTALCSVGMLVSNFVPIGPLEGFFALLVGTWFLTFALYKWFDDYFMALVKIGATWAIAVLGVWMVAQGLLTMFEGFYGIGYTAAGAELAEDDRAFALPAKLNSAYFLASLASCAFFTGFLYNHLRGRA